MARHDEYDDERVVVIERDGGGAAGVGTFLLGLAIGAGAALLFAPASGAETRQRIQDEARRASRKVKDMTDEFGEKVADSVEKTSAWAVRAMRSAPACRPSAMLCRRAVRPRCRHARSSSARSSIASVRTRTAVAPIVIMRVARRPMIR